MLSARPIANSAPIILNFGCDKESKPVIRPRLVMIADVAPKLNLVWGGLFIFTEKTIHNLIIYRILVPLVFFDAVEDLGGAFECGKTFFCADFGRKGPVLDRPQKGLLLQADGFFVVYLELLYAQ